MRLHLVTFGGQTEAKKKEIQANAQTTADSHLAWSVSGNGRLRDVIK